MPNLQSLDPEIDSALKQFYNNLGEDITIDRLKHELNTLRGPYHAFLGRHPGDTALQDNFFNNLTPLWGGILGLYGFDQVLWSEVINASFDWEEKSSPNRVHKGSPFYFWGVSAILQGQIDIGFLLMHKALGEDRIASAQPNPDWPAFKLVTLDSQSPQQFFKHYVDVLSNHLEYFLGAYRVRENSTFSENEFRKGLLAQASEIEHSFLFTYSLAKLASLEEYPFEIKQSSFAGRLETDILFNFVLVVDSVIKHRYPAGMGRFVGFRELLNRALSQAIGLDVQGDELEHVKQQASATSVDTLLNALLDGSFLYQDSSTRSSIGNDISICYLIRNSSAHYATPLQIIPHRFRELVQSILNVLFIAVEKLPV